MGLDSVELVMAFEERFGIEIKDEEAEKLRTPNLVIEFIAKKLNAVSSDYCDTQRAFYRLRRGAIETLKIPRNQLSPQSRLEDMFALDLRQQQWSEFGSFVGALSWPRLQFPTGLSGFVLLTSALISFVSFFLMAGQISVWIKIPLMTILWGLLVSIGFKLANPLRNRFPERMETVADLCRSLVFYCPDNLDQDGRTHNRENIRLLVREIICEQLGVENDFDDNADFIDDLGVD